MAEQSLIGDTVAAVVAVWGIANVGFALAKAVNEKRDTIITGYLEDKKLDRDYRELMLGSDWLPLIAGIFALVFGSILSIAAFLPRVFPKMENYTIETALIAIVVLFVALVVLGSIALNDYLMMRNRIDREAYISSSSSPLKPRAENSDGSGFAEFNLK